MRATQRVACTEREMEEVFYERCRLCCLPDCLSISLFGDDPCRPPGIVDNIRSYLGIEVSEDDDLPHQLCYRCLFQMESFLSFKRVCQSKQHSFKHLKNSFHEPNAVCKHPERQRENAASASSSEQTTEASSKVTRIHRVPQHSNSKQHEWFNCGRNEELNNDSSSNTIHHMTENQDMLSAVTQEVDIYQHVSRCKANLGVNQHLKRKVISSVRKSVCNHKVKLIAENYRKNTQVYKCHKTDFAYLETSMKHSSNDQSHKFLQNKLKVGYRDSCSDNRGKDKLNALGIDVNYETESFNSECDHMDMDFECDSRENTAVGPFDESKMEVRHGNPDTECLGSSCCENYLKDCESPKLYMDDMLEDTEKKIDNFEVSGNSDGQSGNIEDDSVDILISDENVDALEEEDKIFGDSFESSENILLSECFEDEEGTVDVEDSEDNCNGDFEEDEETLDGYIENGENTSDSLLEVGVEDMDGDLENGENSSDFHFEEDDSLGGPIDGEEEMNIQLESSEDNLDGSLEDGDEDGCSYSHLEDDANGCLEDAKDTSDHRLEYKGDSIQNEDNNSDGNLADGGDNVDDHPDDNWDSHLEDTKDIFDHDGLVDILKDTQEDKGSRLNDYRNDSSDSMKEKLATHVEGNACDLDSKKKIYFGCQSDQYEKKGNGGKDDGSVDPKLIESAGNTMMNVAESTNPPREATANIKAESDICSAINNVDEKMNSHNMMNLRTDLSCNSNISSDLQNEDSKHLLENLEVTGDTFSSSEEHINIKSKETQLRIKLNYKKRNRCPVLQSTDYNGSGHISSVNTDKSCTETEEKSTDGEGIVFSLTQKSEVTCHSGIPNSLPQEPDGSENFCMKESVNTEGSAERISNEQNQQSKCVQQNTAKIEESDAININNTENKAKGVTACTRHIKHTGYNLRNKRLLMKDETRQMKQNDIHVETVSKLDITTSDTNEPNNKENKHILNELIKVNKSEHTDILNDSIEGLSLCVNETKNCEKKESLCKSLDFNICITDEKKNLSVTNGVNNPISEIHTDGPGTEVSTKENGISGSEIAPPLNKEPVGSGSEKEEENEPPSVESSVNETTLTHLLNKSKLDSPKREQILKSKIQDSRFFFRKKMCCHIESIHQSHNRRLSRPDLLLQLINIIDEHGNCRKCENGESSFEDTVANSSKDELDVSKNPEKTDYETVSKNLSLISKVRKSVTFSEDTKKNDLNVSIESSSENENAVGLQDKLESATGTSPNKSGGMPKRKTVSFSDDTIGDKCSPHVGETTMSSPGKKLTSPPKGILKKGKDAKLYDLVKKPDIRLPSVRSSVSKLSRASKIFQLVNSDFSDFGNNINSHSSCDQKSADTSNTSSSTKDSSAVISTRLNDGLNRPRHLSSDRQGRTNIQESPGHASSYGCSSRIAKIMSPALKRKLVNDNTSNIHDSIDSHELPSKVLIMGIPNTSQTDGCLADKQIRSTEIEKSTCHKMVCITQKTSVEDQKLEKECSEDHERTVCKICNKTFSDKVELQAHFTNTHCNAIRNENMKSQIVCEKCKCKFHSLHIKKQHLRLVHGMLRKTLPKM